MGKSIFLLTVLIFSNCFSQIVFPSQDKKTLQYGLKSSDGSWILKPEYQYVQDFYHNGYKRDSVGIFQKNEYYKNSNILLKVNYGLFTEKGKNLIPITYKSLYCEKGICMAETHDKKGVILNYKHQKLAEFDGKPEKIRDSVVLFYSEKYNAHYFFSLHNSKINGPFSTISFSDKNLLYAETFSGQRAFYKEDGSIYIRNDSIYGSFPSLYTHDLFLIKNNKGITFSNKEGKLYHTYYKNVPASNMDYCNRYINHGDYQTCAEGGNFDYKDILEYFGFDPSGSFFEVAQSPENDKIITSFSNYKGVSEDKFKTFRFIENTSASKKKYSLRDENNNTVFDSDFPLIEFYNDTGLAVDPKTKDYYLISRKKQIKIDDESMGRPENISVNISFNSRYHVLMGTFKDAITKYFLIDDFGKIIEVPFRTVTNFYNGFALAEEQSAFYLVNEKLEKVKKIENFSNYKYFYINDFDHLGNIIYHLERTGPENKENRLYGMLNYQGKNVIPESVNEIYKENPFFYVLEKTALPGDSNHKRVTILDKNGNKTQNGNEELMFFCYMDGYFVFYYNYVKHYFNYKGERLGDSDEGLNWEITNSGRKYYRN